MRYATLTAKCLFCEQAFVSNPNHVPSIDGEPICRDCVDLVNRQRKESGLDSFPIHPKAYEPLDQKRELLTGRIKRKEGV
jgi:hypothetical protein